MKKEELEYFNRGKAENSKFWSRFEGVQSLKGVRVLDVGCGNGSLCVDMALSGAARVVGIDISNNIIEFAKENLSKNYPGFKDIVDFKCCDISDLSDCGFDMIVSKDSCEHILNLDSVLAEMKKKVRPMGSIYIGFSPLYNSPYGDHKRIRALLPWGHLIFNESFLLKRLNKSMPKVVSSVYDLGLNKLSFAEYRNIFYNSGLHVLYFRVNASKNLILKLFSLIRKIPPLKEYFSYNIYCVLQKRD